MLGEKLHGVTPIDPPDPDKPACVHAARDPSAVRRVGSRHLRIRTYVRRRPARRLAAVELARISALSMPNQSNYMQTGKIHIAIR